MSSNDDFFDGMKSDKDRDKEWTDAAEYFVKLRREPEAEIQPLPEKTASVGEKARMAFNAVKNVDPTGILPVATHSRAGLATALGGGALMGLGAGLMNRGKKELGGQSSLEHSLHESKKQRDESPPPESFSGKMRNNFSDLLAGMATTARKHPVKAGIFAGIGGAGIASKGFQLLHGKAK